VFFVLQQESSVRRAKHCRRHQFPKRSCSLGQLVEETKTLIAPSNA